MLSISGASCAPAGQTCLPKDRCSEISNPASTRLRSCSSAHL